jgi:HD-like signal output (HDOD) protein
VIFKQFANMLGGLFRSNVRPKGDETRERAELLEKNVLRLVGNMPTLPDIATRAMTLANDPNTGTADFARLIERDAAIASSLLRIANSAIYSGGVSAVKLPQAVARLGMLACKNLILSISMKSLIWKMAGNERVQCEALWHHGYVTGYLCRQISRSYRLPFDGGEFSAGLLHDVGRILLLLADPECFARADAMDFREETGLLERERAAIGIDHCALGGCFGEHSKLPDILIEAMRFHHQPDLTEHSIKLVALVATADHMANHLQRGEEAEAYHAEENSGLAYLWARWPEARKERLLDEIPSMMAESLRAAASEQTAC